MRRPVPASADGRGFVRPDRNFELAAESLGTRYMVLVVMAQPDSAQPPARMMDLFVDDLGQSALSLRPWRAGVDQHELRAAD